MKASFISSRVGIFIGISVLFGSALSAATVAWDGPLTGGDWNTGTNWVDNSVPTSSDLAVVNDATAINVSLPVSVDNIIKNAGEPTTTLSGAQITLGSATDSVRSDAGSLVVDNDLVTSASNKRIATFFGGSITINGDLVTNDSVAIRNSSSGTITFNGNRTGGTSSTLLNIQSGIVTATGITAHNGGGILRAQSSGTLVSARTGGPSIETGSGGLRVDSTGTFQFGADDQIGATSVNMNGGTIDLAGFSNATAISSMVLNADSIFDFSDGNAESIVFADLSSETWIGSASLNIAGFGAGDSLRFGTTSGGLTPTQLSQINFDGISAQLNSSGFLTAVPEPASYSLLGAFAALFMCFASRRRIRS